MANTRLQTKIKQVEIIESNMDIMLLLLNIFKGQVLNIDLQELCIALNICEDENEYKGLINKLIKNKLVRLKKFGTTTNNVVIANAPITNYFNINAIKYSAETVVRNSYMTHIIKTRYINTDINALIQYLEENTTFLSSKRRVETCYKPFMKLNENGEEAKLEAIYREEKRKVNLKNMKKDEELVDKELIYEYTMQTLRERDIFIAKNKERYKVYIMDNKNTYTLSKVAEKIALVLCLLSFQTNLELEEYKKLDVLVLVRDEKAKEKLENNFILRYSGGEKINVDKMINEKANKIHNNIKVDFEYQYKNKDIYVLKNPYNDQTEAFKTLRIKIENADTEKKHNSNMKASALVERKRELREQEIRNKLLAELRAKGLLIEVSNELDNI